MVSTACGGSAPIENTSRVNLLGLPEAKIGMLPAGTYFVALVIGDDTVEWRRSDRLARLASTAERVTVGWGATANVTLRAPQ